MSVRTEKEGQVLLLKQELSDVPHAFLVDFRGLNVEGATDLRRRLRDQQARFRVVKNTVALRAVADSALAQVCEAFVGQTAIAYTDSDVVSLAKTLREFTEAFETPRFKAGMVDGQPISAEQFEELAQLPSRQELLAKMVYLMQFPISGLVTVLHAVLRDFVLVLDQVRQHKEKGGE
ncbi:MAG: 50S ribosomal protein L10 [Acidobacteriota bacterium]